MTKHPKTDPPERLTDEQRQRIKTWCKRAYPKILPTLGTLWAECRDWHLANGVMRADWEATMRNWVRTAERFRKERQQNPKRDRYWSETPQEPRPRGKRPAVAIGDVIRIEDFRGGDDNES